VHPSGFLAACRLEVSEGLEEVKEADEIVEKPPVLDLHVPGVD
jgi:hypothetical protein